MLPVKYKMCGKSKRSFTITQNFGVFTLPHTHTLLFGYSKQFLYECGVFFVALFFFYRFL